MRLRQRRNVDLPQPDGPMMAVTSFTGKSSERSCTACVAPNQASSPTTRMATGSLASAELTGNTATPPLVDCSINDIGHARAGDEAREQADREHERNQHERTGPCLLVPVVIRTDGIHEDLERQRGN